MRSGCFLFCGMMVLSASVSGCFSLRAHLEDRARVDQELPAGGEEQYPNRSKTRKVIVIELEEKNKSEEAVVSEAVAPIAPVSGESKVVSDARETTVVHDRNFTFPKINPKEITQPVAPTLTVERYTVQKDDTLQKISKKLYGSYSKWTMIYEANREVVKDPNFLKPGTSLKIPVLPEASSPSSSVPKPVGDQDGNK